MQHFAISSTAVNGVSEQYISKQPHHFLASFHMKAIFYACTVEMNTTFLYTVLFGFHDLGQIKRLEEHKAEQDKQLKAMSKQMKVGFLRKIIN